MVGRVGLGRGLDGTRQDWGLATYARLVSFDRRLDAVSKWQ